MLYCAVRLRGVCPSLPGLPLAAVHPPKPALDDEREARERLRQEAARFKAEEHTKFEILEFDSAASFLSEGGRTCDILFLDIDMPQMTGMELAEKIRETDSEVIIIFCTNLLLGAALAFLLVWGCFDCSAVQALFTATCAYTVQHITSKVTYMVVVPLGLFGWPSVFLLLMCNLLVCVLFAIVILAIEFKNCSLKQLENEKWPSFTSRTTHPPRWCSATGNTSPPRRTPRGTVTG